MYAHHDIVSQMEERIAVTITSVIHDHIANSRYVGIIVDETTNITIEKMLITYLTLQQKGEPETMSFGNYAIPFGTAECITAKIKDMLLGLRVTMVRVVGLGTDGTFSVLRTEYIVEVTKSIKKRFPSEHVGIIADCNMVLNASCYPGAHSTLKNYGLDALERICDHYSFSLPSSPPDCKLTSRERAKLCFRATRCKPHQATSGAVKKYTFADLNLGNERIISSATPCGDFFFRCCLSSESQRVDVASARTSSSSKSQGSVPAVDRTSDITNMVKKCNELDLNIIVIWKEAQEMVLFKFKSELPPPVVLPSAELSQLIKTNLHYPETYTHPFLRDSPESLEVHSSFTWVGQTQYKLQLKPQEVLCLTLRACFLQAGVYNLNTPRVFAKPTEQDAMCETSQQTASPALIIINNA
eukprot:superscaffoldBa00000067_g1082